MTRTDQRILSATFLFTIFGLPAMAIMTSRFLDRYDPPPPLVRPQDEPLEPVAPIVPPPIVPPPPSSKNAPKVARRVKKHGPASTPGAPVKTCDDDPLCGLGPLDK